MTRSDVFIQDYALVSALGPDRTETAARLFATEPTSLRDRAELSDGRVVPVGRVSGALGAPAHETRTNQLIAHCITQLVSAIDGACATYGARRIGVVIGTSTSGIGEGGEAARAKLESGRFPAGFSLSSQQLGDSARFAAAFCGAEGPAYVVSTACTSGAKALAAGARLIRADLCDAVLCGGADALCDLTLNGFAALDSLSSAPCNPMSAHRDGLNIGEGAALFLLSLEPAAFRLAGSGESADAHHISAPDPTGAGAEAAMRQALEMADMSAAAIDYLHLHGTATRLNDQMEARVVHRLFGSETPASSTKPLTGHTLGAAGAVQAALCLLALENGCLPPHLWDGARDRDLPAIRLAAAGERAPLKTVLSASYAFGGNNSVLILAAS